MTPSIARGRTRLLYTEVRWLMGLRWIAGALIVTLGLADHLWFRAFDMGSGPVLLGVAILLYNAALWFVLRQAPRLAIRFDSLLQNFASVQIVLDIACLALLATWTGGLESPLLGAFVFHMLFASLLQNRPRAYGAAIVSILAVSLTLLASDQWPQTTRQRLVGLGWACTLLVAVYLSERITSALYRREAARARHIERIRAMASHLRASSATLVQNEKMVAMGQLAAGVAHEITNPLANMDSLLQLMQRRAGQGSDDSTAQLREQVQRILRIVRQLTTFAHPGQGRVETVPVNDVVRAVIDMLALNRKAKGVRLECDCSPDVGAARVNSHALEQVLTNLIVNALDAVAGRPSPAVQVRTRRDHTHCIIEVTDNGSGIPPEHLPRVFEPFFTTKPVGQGTGLGLSICARLMRDHGGTIDVRSTSGEGTTFTVLIPDTYQTAVPLASPASIAQI